jgi:integrase/recombinase XerD
MSDRKPKGGRKHEGWIAERGGVQYAFFRHGRRRYAESSCSSRIGDAKRLLERMRREILADSYVPPRDRARLEREAKERERAEAGARELSTVARLAARWLETSVPTARNAKGQKLAASRVKAYFVPFLGERLAAEITAEDLRRYRLWLAADERKLSSQTVAHVLSEARSFFSWAAESKHVAASPVPRKLLPKQPDREPKAFTDEEREIVAALPDPFGFACRLMLGTGVRWGELVLLKALDVKDGALVLVAPKNGKLRRIPLHPALLQEIRGHVGKLVPWTGGKDYHVFLKAVRRLSALPAFGAHQCRHTFAFRWIWNGGSLSALQAILGHASVTTTEIYARTNDALVRREAERQWAAQARSGTL